MGRGRVAMGALFRGRMPGVLSVGFVLNVCDAGLSLVSQRGATSLAWMPHGCSVSFGLWSQRFPLSAGAEKDDYKRQYFDGIP